MVLNPQSFSLFFQMVNMNANGLGNHLGSVSPSTVLSTSTNAYPISPNSMLVPHQLSPLTPSTPTSLALMAPPSGSCSVQILIKPTLKRFTNLFSLLLCAESQNTASDLVSLNNSNNATAWTTIGGSIPTHHHHPQMHIPRSCSPPSALITTTLNPLSPSGYHPYSSSGFVSAPQPRSHPQPFYTTW